MNNMYIEPRIRVVEVDRLDTLCAASEPFIDGGEPGTEGGHGQSKRNSIWFYLEAEDSEEDY